MLLLSTAWAFDHDHAALGDVLDGLVSEAGVDYAGMAKRKPALDAYLGTLAEAPVDTFDTAQQLAFWVNAYNAATLQMMLDEGPPKSIRDLDGGNPWKKRTFRVGGADVTLDHMEHGRARELTDGRVHAWVNCASRGCPPLNAVPLKAAGIEAQLDAGMKRWAATNAYVVDGETIRLNKIFDWYGEDFAAAAKGKPDIPYTSGKQEAALHALSAFSDDARLTSGDFYTAWNPYDWSLNRAE